MKPETAIEILVENGWRFDHAKGSHRFYVKKGYLPVSVPYHKTKELSPYVLSSLEKSTGIPFTKWGRNVKKKKK